MASEEGKEIQAIDSQKKGAEAKEKSLKLPPPPPPPEKPLPGDCCGSGCVRCVWDVYYDKLDAYDKLCEKGSASNSP